MALKPSQQFFELIKRSQAPLLIIPTRTQTDGYASAIACGQMLNKLQKQPTIVAVDGPVPVYLSFLKQHEQVQTTLTELRKLLIILPTSKTKIAHIQQESKDGFASISIVPDQGFWKEHEIQIVHSGYRFDLIICFGASDLEACSHLYQDHPEFFFQTPIVNIDHCPANEYFGQINLVDLNACSTSEICFHLFEEHAADFIDEPMATALLTGIIAKTKSFKTTNVRPHTLQTASRLIQKGAQREMIIQHLYRTRSLSTLRLWGRALARLKHLPEQQIVWTLLSRQDFIHAGAEETDLPDIIHELLSTSPEAKKILLLYEDQDQNICAILHVEPPLDAMELSYPFRPAGTREQARMCFIGKNLIQAEKEIFTHLQKTSQ